MGKTILASGLTLSYADQGDPSGPAVSMLPGPTDSWRSYQPALDRLPRDVRTIAVSQRGHGESGKPEKGYCVEDFAADVVPLLDGPASSSLSSPNSTIPSVRTSHRRSSSIRRRRTWRPI